MTEVPRTFMNDHDDNDDRYGDESDREGPPAVSRLHRGGTRGYRVLSRAGRRYQARDRYARQRKQLPVAELIGRLIGYHGLTDEVRQRFICLYWPEIAGERIASRTFPVSFSDGVLHVSATNSSWVHEMQFLKAQLIVQINGWIDDNRVWLGPPPLVAEIRCALAMPRREPLVDPEHARRLRLQHSPRRWRTHEAVPPPVSDAERGAIRRETSTIVDAELRAMIEAVRMKWNR
jgi:Dna[CI] antecedent, DciA